ncbi:transcription factor IIA, alpha/beta subunit [Amniculicola lignicola CBS 123094]|uniref:Transcription factor IIA, alpha/beta subunit n=1 Tax=Amniculicola lignicola CBS 123094 TaxID=1392246 RepID=A0A6A5X1C9_9PLEO|nr:transcription factor IIA, alpha/beta subunit [Amniculicola lignicola CBS 123094]
MSNIVVGGVYQAIIEKVIQASQNDFEEFGVDQSTLDEMRDGWQEKLSALKVASFPWDPQPEPVRQPPTLPSNVKHETSNAPQPQTSQPEHVNFPNIPIKSERFDQPPMSAYPQPVQNGYQSGFNEGLAQQRAQALVAQRLGQHVPPPQQQQQQQHGGQVPMHGQQQRMMPGQQQQRPPQQMQQQQRPQQQPHVYTSQTDGADDAYSHDALAQWEAFKAARAAAGEQGRLLADETMRAQLDAMAHSQDSGLMVPLSEHPSCRKRKDITRVLQRREIERQAAIAGPSVGPAGFDGSTEEVKEEDPDDAINSDLDDPEDDIDNGDDDDDDNVDYMLCTYDKVQRVKNKWKCTLKDGILTTNKKEYLFHKATGEFEW